MKIFTRLPNGNNNVEKEIELSEVAVFADIDEIQQLIDFLTYVKKDHIVQRDVYKLSSTHNHFSMWKGENIIDSQLDLSIYTVFKK